MSFSLARPVRNVSFSIVLALAASAAGCATATDASNADAEQSSDEITNVEHTEVKRQSIGNCWVYATATWAESLHESATGVETNISESYWTYWHWFDEITSGRASKELETGGWWGTAVDIALARGLMAEADFIPEEATEPRSSRQSAALATINTALKEGGELGTDAARRDPAKVRKALDAAWGLADGVKLGLDAVFGLDGAKKLTQSGVVIPADLKLVRASEFDVKLLDPTTKQPVQKKLSDAVGTAQSTWNPDSRSGAFAWTRVNYPETATARRTLQLRIQRALHDKQPVVISWFVDFAAMTGGAFKEPPAAPGRQGGHMTVMEDYQVDTKSPTFGVLAAGIDEARPDALEAALSPTASIEFFRIKNSWGTADAAAEGFGGYHDLYLTYLDAKLQKNCADKTDPAEKARCEQEKRNGFTNVILPKGY